MREDTDLNSACHDAERALSTLRIQLTDLQCADVGNKKLQTKVDAILDTSDKFFS